MGKNKYSDAIFLVLMIGMSATLIVLAAGMGSRYGGLKQLDGFGPHQEPLLMYSVYDALQAGFDHVVFIIREEFAEEFKTRIGNPVSAHVRVSYVYQEITAFLPPAYAHLADSRQKPRGTAHATLVAKELVDTPFAVINADDFYGRDAYTQMARALQTITPNTLAMVGYVFENTLSLFGSVNRGVCTVEGEKLVSIHESLQIAQAEDGNWYDKDHHNILPNDIVSMNFRGFHHSFFTYVENYFTDFLASYSGSGEYFIPLVVDHCIHHHHMKCMVMMSKEKRCGVSYQEDRPFVEKEIALLHDKGVYPHDLFV